MAGAAPSSVKSATRTLDIIEFVVAHNDGVAAQEISATLAIPVSSLSYLLGTLTERNYLRRDGRSYFPGPGLERLQSPAALTLEARVRPLVRALRAELDETASFMVRRGWEIEALVTEASAQALRYSIEPGQCKPLYSLAAGKVLLAQLDSTEFERFLAETERNRLTPKTIVSAEALRATCDHARRAEFARADEEDTLGTCGFAVPAIDAGAVLGAFAVVVPVARLTADLECRVEAALRKAAAGFNR